MTTNSRKCKSESQVAAQQSSDDENIAAPAKKTKATLDMKKQPAPRPIPKQSTSTATAREAIWLDRATNEAGIPKSFVTPIHWSTTSRIGNQKTISGQSHAQNLRCTGISTPDWMRVKH